MERSALLLVDVQHDFVDGPAAIAGTADRLDAMVHVANAFRHACRPIVHVVRRYRPGDHDADVPRRAAVESGARIAAPVTDATSQTTEHRMHDLTLIGVHKAASDEVDRFPEHVIERNI